MNYQGERLDYAALVSWTADLFAAVGVPQGVAVEVADLLVRTDARGFGTHGLSRLKSYMEKIANGEVSASAKPEEWFEGAFGTINACNLLGQIAGPLAIRKGIERTENQPLSVYMLRDVGHLGALGMHVLLAAEAGRVAVMLQATPPIIGLPGATGPMIGNNPFAFAAPRADAPPLVVDIACSVAARGNILNAVREERPIPEGWAVDENGNSTTDARRALAGWLQPFGGQKGMMISMLVELLAGSLSGQLYNGNLNLDRQVRSAIGNLNAMIFVINPSLMAGRDAYDAHMQAWTENYKANGGPDARIPGERAAASEIEARRNGVLLSPGIVKELQLLGVEAGKPFVGA